MLFKREIIIAIHSLARAKGYLFTLVLTLGITLGVLVAAFTAYYQSKVVALPYPAADQLIVLRGQRVDRGHLLESYDIPYPAVFQLFNQAQKELLDPALIAYTVSVERRLPDSPLLSTAAVTPNFLHKLQAPLLMGRHFSETEGVGSMSPVMIISHGTWQRIFHGDPRVLGKTLNIMEVDFTIIGVLSPDFIEPEINGFGQRTDIWLPFDYNDFPQIYRKDWRASMGGVFILANLSSSQGLQKIQAKFSADLNGEFKNQLAGNAGAIDAGVSVMAQPLSQVIARDSAYQSLLLLMGVFALLFIACANVLNLMLARQLKQQRNFVIQIALGANKRHIFSAVLIESLLIMMLSFFVAVIVSWSCISAIKHLAAGLFPRLDELRILPQSIIFITAVAMGLAFIFARLVCWQLNFRSLNTVLQSSGKGTGLQVSASMRNTLIASQIAFTGVLLIVGVQVFSQSIYEITKTVGYKTADQYQANLSVATLWESTSQAQRREYFKQLAELIRQWPAVKAVGLSNGSPVNYNGGNYSSFISPSEFPEKKISAVQTISDVEYIKILDFPLTKGRFFTPEEAETEAPVALVNEFLAKQLRSDGEVLGSMFYRQGDDPRVAYEIVGVIKDIQLPGVANEPRFFRAGIGSHPELLIQMKPNQVISAIDVNKQAALINPQLKVFALSVTDQLINSMASPQRTSAGLAAALSLFALVLAAIGVYGVFSYNTQLRRFELGVRMAIGARPKTIFAQVLSDNLKPVSIGLAAAMAATIALWLIWGRTGNLLDLTIGGILVPIMLILVLTTGLSWLSVWQMITRPVGAILRVD